MAQAVTTAEANRALGRGFFEGQDRERGGPPDALCDAGYRAHIGGNPPMDRAGHDRFARAFYAAFPDIHHAIDEVFATDDRVGLRFTLTGSHTGDFFGIPPTGRAVRVTATILMRVRGGRVSELYGTFDEAGLLRQLGVLPGN